MSLALAWTASVEKRGFGRPLERAAPRRSSVVARTAGAHPGARAGVVVRGSWPDGHLRPWEDDLIPSLVPAVTDWRVLEQARVELLDARTTVLIGRWPELCASVAGRFLRRSRSL